MKFELLELREDRIRYLLSGVSAAFANGIRRACMSEVPVLAMDEISLYDNTSVLFDEQISLQDRRGALDCRGPERVLSAG